MPDTDFKQLIADLESVGISIYRIAQMMCEAGLEIQYKQVHSWATGSEPKYRAANLIIEFHSKHYKRNLIPAAK